MLVFEKSLSQNHSSFLSLQVFVTSDVSLYDLQWHSLNLEWNLKELSVILDKKSTLVKLATKTKEIYHRPFRLAPKIFLGTNQHSQNGYLGCMRSLWIQGQNIKFEDPLINFKDNLLGVKRGCHGSCDSQPCQNNGVCLEHYANYSCNCSATAFKGRTCNEDVSVHFDGSFAIKTNLSTLVKLPYSNTVSKCIIIYTTYVIHTI